MKVWLRGGVETWLLIHVEVERRPGPDFAERLYVYNYRIFDRYHREVITLVVLTDVGPKYRLLPYRVSRWGFSHTFELPVINLASYRSRRSELEAEPNPFSLVVLAHLAARETRGKGRRLLDWKLQLVRLLYARGYTREDVLELLRFLDWLLALPEEVEVGFWEEVRRLEEGGAMPHVLSIERIAERRGEVMAKAEDVLVVLRARGLGVTEEERQQILGCRDRDRLQQWLERAVTASSTSDVLDGVPADS